MPTSTPRPRFRRRPTTSLPFSYFNDFSSGSLLPALSTDTHGGVWPTNGVVSWGASDPYVTTAQAPSGSTHSLAFDFPATAGPSGDINREQNLAFGQPIGSFWMEFDLRVSPGFEARDPGQPTKFWQFWGGAYSASTTVGITLRSEAGGYYSLQPFVTGDHPLYSYYGFGQIDPQTYHQPYGNRFIAPLAAAPGAIIPGQWHRVRQRIQFASSSTALDGSWELWVDDNLFMSAVGNIWSWYPLVEGPPKLRGGYLMGYSNSGYDEATAFHWANLRITEVDPGWVFGDPEPFFIETFADGTQHNANGFVWEGLAGTISTEQAHSGTHSLRLQYNANGPNTESWIEQRFDMGRYCSELALEYWVHVPSNFKHRARSDSTPTNNKFLALWRDPDDYTNEANDWQVLVEWWRRGDTESWARQMSTRWDRPYASNVLEEPNEPTLISPTGPLIPGQWNRIRLYVKAASSRTASDGVYQLWANDVQLSNVSNGQFQNASDVNPDVGLRSGYVMGYANSGFDAVTVFHLDDFKFYESLPASWVAQSFTPNLPAGLAIRADVMFDATFDNTPPVAPETNEIYPYKTATINKFDAGRTSVVAGQSETGGHVLRATAPAGYVAGNLMQLWPTTVVPSSNVRHAYWAFTMRVDSANVWHSSGQKLVYPVILVDGADYLQKPGIAFDVADDDPTRFRFEGFQMMRWDGSVLVGFLATQNRDNRSFSRDQWYRIEVEMHLEAAGRAANAQNGELRIWTSEWNGTSYDAPVLITEYTDLLLGMNLASTDKRFYSLSIDTYRGGSGGPAVVVDAKLDFSRFHWSAA